MRTHFAESTRPPRPAAADYPGPDDGRLLAVEASVRRGWRESSKRSSPSVGADAPFRGEGIARPEQPQEPKQSWRPQGPAGLDVRDHDRASRLRDRQSRARTVTFVRRHGPHRRSPRSRSPGCCSARAERSPHRCRDKRCSVSSDPVTRAARAWAPAHSVTHKPHAPAPLARRRLAPPGREVVLGRHCARPLGRPPGYECDRGTGSPETRSSPNAGLAQWRAQSPTCIGNGGATWLRCAGSQGQPLVRGRTAA